MRFHLFFLNEWVTLFYFQPDEQTFLISIMDWLETFKNANRENEAVTSEVVGQAHLENYALRLFQYADKNDREANFNKNIVKAFFSAGQVYDVLQVFGELTEEAQHNRKYAKWKAAYIHNCLKNGETPIAGPMATEGEDEFKDLMGGGGGGGQPSQPPTMGFVNPNQPGPSAAAGSVDDFDPLKLPAPPKDPEKSPGGFKPYVPSERVVEEYEVPADVPTLSPELAAKAQKYCKWAGSALNYDDVPTAIESLQKALRLLQTGQDS